MRTQKSCSLWITAGIIWFIFLVLEQFSSPVQCEVHFHTFIVRETNFTKLCDTKSALVVNESFPGPEIRVHKGDTVFVNVYNEGYYGFTIHWHGIKQPRNPWSDGPEYITQCPIPPGTNFTYEIQTSTEEGTVWWHAHSDWTRATVHGAIVVLPAVGTTFPFPEPDEEETLILSSWYTGDIKALVDEAMQEGTDLPESDGYTINGEPGDLSICSNDTSFVRVVDYGKTYLLRVINANINGEMFFGVAKHNLTVVGVDGAYIKPINTAYIVLAPGHTTDVLLKTDQTPARYYMVGRHYTTQDSSYEKFFDHQNVTAILEYRGNYTYQTPLFPAGLPMYYDNSAAVAFSSQLRSLGSPEHPVHVPLNLTTRMYITVSMNFIFCTHPGCILDTLMATSLNNASWENPTISNVLEAYYRNISGIYTTDFPDQPPFYYNFTDDILDDNITYTIQGAKVKMLNYNESVEIVFQGTNVLDGSINHPMHMHGYSFYVVGSGYGNYDDVNDPKGFNLVDPPQVNTFSVPKNGWLAIRFFANNPGVWFWHCHLERHSSWGMNTVFIIRNGGTPETSMRGPPAYMPPCESSSLDSPIRKSHGHEFTQQNIE